MSRKKHRDKTIIKTAGTLVSFLRHNGVRIMRYDSYSSNSIYLKLDYGLLYSIRISDHRGKEHLRYRFNVIKGYRWLPGTVHDTAGGDPLPVDGPYVITTRGDNHTIWWRLPEWDRVPGEGLPLSYEKWHAVTRTKWLKAKGDNHE